MPILAIACVYENSDKVEHVFFPRFGGVTEVVYMVRADVDRRWELEMIIDLPPTEVIQIKLESFEMEDEIVRNFLQTCSITVRFG